eukprot:TRINITY_DN4528_c0_g2_i1.p1 TRINITY_DN4528_c0_g2~~TRINITY_DN4528_c0_g2_i1.p1  ORF type:complete len:639 (-),score=49.49 TRINITY_DN4528_c0_g2_i1:67-1983(-)
MAAFAPSFGCAGEQVNAWVPGFLDVGGVPCSDFPAHMMSGCAMTGEPPPPGAEQLPDVSHVLAQAAFMTSVSRSEEQTSHKATSPLEPWQADMHDAASSHRTRCDEFELADDRHGHDDAFTSACFKDFLASLDIDSSMTDSLGCASTGAETDASKTIDGVDKLDEETEGGTGGRLVLHQECALRSCHLHSKAKRGCRACEKLQQKSCAPSKDSCYTTGSSQKADLVDELILTNVSTYNLNSKLRCQILRSPYYKSLALKSFEDILGEIYHHADHAEPYSVTVRGEEPSTLFCCLYHLFTLKIGRSELRDLLHHQGSPFIRATGFLYVRYGCEPRSLMHWCRDLLFDTERFFPSCEKNVEWNLGEWVAAMIESDKYYGTVLPRIPASFKLESGPLLLQMKKLRQLYARNVQDLHCFRSRGTRLQVMLNADWIEGTLVSLKEDRPTCIRCIVKVDARTYELPLGMVILKNRRSISGPRSRSRSRSRSRPRGKHVANTDLIDDIVHSENVEKMKEIIREREKDRATSASGQPLKKISTLKFHSVYNVKSFSSYDGAEASHPQARRKVNSGLQQHQQHEAEVTEPLSRTQTLERQQQLHAVFAKYGSAGCTSSASRLAYHNASGLASTASDMIEKPETLRLG